MYPFVKHGFPTIGQTKRSQPPLIIATPKNDWCPQVLRTTEHIHLLAVFEGSRLDRSRAGIKRHGLVSLLETLLKVLLQQLFDHTGLRSKRSHNQNPLLNLNVLHVGCCDGCESGILFRTPIQDKACDLGLTIGHST